MQRMNRKHILEATTKATLAIHDLLCIIEQELACDINPDDDSAWKRAIDDGHDAVEQLVKLSEQLASK